MPVVPVATDLGQDRKPTTGGDDDQCMGDEVEVMGGGNEWNFE
jgi:hypothetical protein